MIWLLIALSASATMAIILIPSLRGGPRKRVDGLGAFASQLEELARDRGLGLISENEAKTAEQEIKRRWLNASERDDEIVESAPSRNFRASLIGLTAACAMLAVVIYMQIGSAHLIGAAPVETAQAPEAVQEVLDEIDALAASLIETPDNPEGWYVLGQAYMAMGRYGEAAIAFNNVIDRVPENAGLFSTLGRAYVFAENGIITPAAQEAFVRAYELDPEDVMARFFLAEAVLQAGDADIAIAEWRALADSLEAGSEARLMVETRLDMLDEN